MPTLDDEDDSSDVSDYINSLMANHGLGQGALTGALAGAPPALPQEAIAPAPNVVRDAIAQKYGLGPSLDANALKDAQSKAKEDVNQANASEGFNDIARAISGQAPQSDPYYDQLRTQAQAPVQNLLQLRKTSLEDTSTRNNFTENDPASPVSKSVQDAYIRLGFPEDSVRQLSASELKQIQSPAEMKAKLDEQKQLKQMQLAYLQDRNNTPKPGDGLKQAMASDKLAQNLKKDLDANIAKAGNFGKVSATLIQAQKLKALAEDFNGNPKNLTPQQMEELGTSLASLLGGGQVSDSRVKNLVPTSAQGNSQAFKQWLFNEPEGTNQQAFVKNMMDTVNREADLANKQLNVMRKQRLPAHSALKAANPDVYNSVLAGYGLTPNGDVAPEAAPSSMPQQVSKHISSKDLNDYATLHYGAASPENVAKAKQFLGGQGIGVN